MAELYKTLQKEFYGDNVRWFLGIVEDNKNDPEFLGRVRVRVFGAHSPFLEDVPTEMLPWARILIPATYGGISGVGRSPTGIEQGSWVFGVFMDGLHSQDPLILGTIPKIELPPGEDYKDAKKLEPSSIESGLGGAGGAVNATSGGGTTTLNYSQGQITFETGMQKGYGEAASSALGAVAAGG